MVMWTACAATACPLPSTAEWRRWNSWMQEETWYSPCATNWLSPVEEYQFSAMGTGFPRSLFVQNVLQTRVDCAGINTAELSSRVTRFIFMWLDRCTEPRINRQAPSRSRNHVEKTLTTHLRDPGLAQITLWPGWHSLSSSFDRHPSRRWMMPH